MHIDEREATRRGLLRMGEQTWAPICEWEHAHSYGDAPDADLMAEGWCPVACRADQQMRTSRWDYRRPVWLDVDDE